MKQQGPRLREGWAETSHCHIHDVEEPVPSGDAWIGCFECGHIFKDGPELKREFLEAFPATPSGLIPFCPLCLHDFP